MRILYMILSYMSYISYVYYVLQWLHIYMYILLCCLVGLFFNNGLLNLLILSDVLMIALFGCCLVVFSFFNIYYMLGISFFIFIFSSIEIIFSFLIVNSN